MLRWAPRILAIAVILSAAAFGVAVVRDEGLSPSSDPRLPKSATTTPPQPEGPWRPLPDDGPSTVVLTPAGIVAPVLAENADGSVVVQTPCEAMASVAGSHRLEGAHIVLDPGHGGDEPGAVGANGLLEKDVNLAVAQRAAEVLRSAGATVVLTRETDLRVTIATRAAIALGLQPVAFVSIHHNAAPDGPSTIPGTEVYFQIASPESRRLAGLLVEEVRAALTPFGGPWESDLDNGAKARVRAENPAEDFFGVLRRTAGVPAVLSEAGYLSNPAEAELYAREDVQQAEAEAIARALSRFVTGEVPADSVFSLAPPATGGGGGGGGTAGCVDPPLG